MPKLVEDHALILLGDFAGLRYPAIVHSGLSGGDTLDILGNVRPRTAPFIEGNTHGRVSASNELELEVGVLLPFFDDRFDFLLLDLRTCRTDEGACDGLHHR